MTARLHQAIRTTVRKAKTEFPHAFNRLNEDEELVLEALEEQQTTVLDVMMYTRYDKVRVQELLRGLIDRGHVREEVARGSDLRLYTIIRKNH